MSCSMWLFSPNFDAKSIIFPNYGQGPFPKIAGQGPDIEKSWEKRSTNINILIKNTKHLILLILIVHMINNKSKCI